MKTVSEEQEAEANEFAIQLLCPLPMLEKELKKIGPLDLTDDRKLIALAKKFQVPISILTLQLGRLSTVHCSTTRKK